jgi:hypothetical protein
MVEVQRDRRRIAVFLPPGPTGRGDVRACRAGGDLAADEAGVGVVAEYRPARPILGRAPPRDDVVPVRIGTVVRPVTGSTFRPAHRP